ncbi:hypothetical protein LY90DRAFT_698090 [Neocallimastix californiae]|uniref:Ribosome biogenesis protein SLX9 n=1 Tax=Neocallimastix californiae TaxID=1754190 RepID=A0A1Y2F716_9FUNG|nr:hypothetical protein LY90DRAFT_698090 [Neocallimastix californiae]|eukprot:ORY79649.1 hypothetical protein LY90DRAFT_698090 [Neocallimastix californiae]
MPKIKRERTRYHARPIDSSHISNRPFSVQDNAVKKFSTSENTKPENLAEIKKDRRRQRHENWLNKLNQAYSKKKKTKTQISLNQIKDAIDIVHEDIVNADNSGVAPKLSKNSRKNLAIQEMIRFQNILKLNEFKSNPMAAIQEHLKNTLPQKDTTEKMDEGK